MTQATDPLSRSVSCSRRNLHAERRGPETIAVGFHRSTPIREFTIRHCPEPYRPTVALAIVTGDPWYLLYSEAFDIVRGDQVSRPVLGMSSFDWQDLYGQVTDDFRANGADPIVVRTASLIRDTSADRLAVFSEAHDLRRVLAHMDALTANREHFIGRVSRAAGLVYDWGNGTWQTTQEHGKAIESMRKAMEARARADDTARLGWVGDTDPVDMLGSWSGTSRPAEQHLADITRKLGATWADGASRAYSPVNGAMPVRPGPWAHQRRLDANCISRIEKAVHHEACDRRPGELVARFARAVGQHQNHPVRHVLFYADVGQLAAVPENEHAHGYVEISAPDQVYQLARAALAIPPTERAEWQAAIDEWPDLEAVEASPSGPDTIYTLTLIGSDVPLVVLFEDQTVADTETFRADTDALACKVFDLGRNSTAGPLARALLVPHHDAAEFVESSSKERRHRALNQLVVLRDTAGSFMRRAERGNQSDRERDLVDIGELYVRQLAELYRLVFGEPWKYRHGQRVNRFVRSLVTRFAAAPGTKRCRPLADCLI